MVEEEATVLSVRRNMAVSAAEEGSSRDKAGHSGEGRAVPVPVAGRDSGGSPSAVGVGRDAVQGISAGVSPPAVAAESGRAQQAHPNTAALRRIDNAMGETEGEYAVSDRPTSSCVHVGDGGSAGGGGSRNQQGSGSSDYFFLSDVSSDGMMRTPGHGSGLGRKATSAAPGSAAAASLERRADTRSEDDGSAHDHPRLSLSPACSVGDATVALRATESDQQQQQQYEDEGEDEGEDDEDEDEFEYEDEDELLQRHLG
ncbi:unnamed protein product, partial [Sphacelaria rigidula]